LAELVATRPRGTLDVLPAEAGRWQRVERIARDLAARYGFGEIRTPAFEHTELIHRLGASTDVVQKETYDFVDRGGRRLTLRPEGTAPAVRAVLQGGLLNQGLPVKVYYVNLSAFRYERPEAGRLRQHHQFGCEVFGVEGPAAEAELMALLADFLREVGVRGAVAHLNSLGCEECRPRYREALRAYYAPRLGGLCPDCQRRFEHNPLRLLDCKVDREAAREAPRAVDTLCPACARHLAELEALLRAAEVPFERDHLLVRGFDYYTRTVFEFVHERLGAQASLGGGGRYDGLVASLGGPSVPAAGFGVGMERLLLALDSEGVQATDARPCELFVAGEERQLAFTLCLEARRAGLAAEFDAMGRSLKAQFRHADRLGARCVAVVQGPHDPLVLRDMLRHEQSTVDPGHLVEAVRAILGGAG
jgi:histidyl-tRNA synthetase